VRKVIHIQRDLIWGGVRGGQKICWVKWRRVCQPRSKGSLGVQDVKLVNMSLMAKWKWRLLQEDLPLWKVVLREKYGDSISGFPPEGGSRWPRFSSVWWKVLSTFEGSVGVNWVSNRVVWKVSNGRGTSFWKDMWIRDQSLAYIFPRLFNISSHKEAKIRDLWNSLDGVVVWNLGWRRQPFLWEYNLIAILWALIEGVILGE